MAKIRGLLAAAAGAVWAALSIGGCTAGAESLTRETGVIFEVTDSGVYLAPEGTDGIDGATFISFSGPEWHDAGGKDLLPEEITVGQVVSYSYASALETWPSSLYGCEEVSLTGETEDVSGLVAAWNASQAELSGASEDGYGMPTLQILQQNGKTASSTSPLRGTSSWSRDGRSVMQDSGHPLRWEDAHLVSVSLSQGTRLTLSFGGTDGAPDAVTIRRWDASDRGSRTIPDGETVDFSEGFAFEAKPDSVYEVSAQWDGEDAGGRLTWGFQTAD